MSDLVIQVLIGKLSNIRHIYVQTSTKGLEFSSRRIYNSRNQMKAYVQASGTKAQVLALLSHTELQRYKPRLKERRFCPFVPYMYIAPQ